MDTSGIVQPPIHATAALRLYELSESASRRSRSWKSSRRSSARGTHTSTASGRGATTGSSRSGTLGVRHGQLAALGRGARTDQPDRGRDPRLPARRRRARGPVERPTDGEYDRYVYLVGLFRELDYRPDRIQDATPFALQSVLFNSLLVQSNRDLAQIARLLGNDPDYEAWARLTAAGIDARLWSEEDALYVDYDLGAERHVGARTAAGLSPLHAGIPTAERARQMVGRLAASRVEVNGGELGGPELSPDDPGFLPARYWRGPIWPILNWALQRGLDRYGYGTLAAQVRRALIDLASREGFWEHYSPLTGKGQGGESFAWTAGLVLDVLATEMESGKEDVRMEEEHPKAVEPTSKSETERRE